MKKLACLFLCCFLLFTASCANNDTNAYITQDPLLTSLQDALIAKDSTQQVVLVSTSSLDTASQRVKTDRNTLQAISDLLTRQRAEKVSIRDVDTQNVLSTVTLEGGTPLCSATIYGCGPSHSDYPGQTVLQLQIGEDRGQYLYDGTVYEQIRTLVQSNIVPLSLSFEGAYLPLTPDDSQQDDSLAFKDMLVFETSTVLLFSSESRSVIEFFDNESGESIHREEFFSKALRMEKDALQKDWRSSYDFRVLLMDGTVPYKSSVEPEDTFLYELPPLMRNMMKSGDILDYDVSASSGILIYQDEEGIYSLEQQGTVIFPLLLNNDLSSEEAFGTEEATPAVFSRPRIMNGGRVLVAQASPTGTHIPLSPAVVVCTLDYMQVTYFPGLLSGKDAYLDYPNGTTVAAFSEDEMTLIDLTTYEAASRTRLFSLDGSSNTGLTTDYEQFFYTTQQYLDDGDLKQVFRNESGEPFFSCQGQALTVLSTQNGVALCSGKENGKTIYILVPFP